MMKEINQLAYVGAGLASGTILNNNTWKAFGFKGRPKRGKFFEFLVSKQKLKVEKFLIRELLAISIVDIAQALKLLNNYIQPHCDYRTLLLTGIICNIWKFGQYDDLENLLDTITEANNYTSDSTNNNIINVFIQRLSNNVELDNKKRTQIMFGAATLLANANKENGLTYPNDAYRKQFEQYTPKGTLSPGLSRDQVDKIIEVALILINN